MNIFVNAFARMYQGVFYIAALFIKFPQPIVISGANKLCEIPDLLIEKGKKHPLIVTDEGIFSLGLVDPLLFALKEKKMPYSIYHSVVANPTIDNINDGLKIYNSEECDCLVAVGGGSAMDACKGIGARVANPNKTVSQLRGVYKVKKKIPFMIAVPTTAGTGSETTVAAVIVDKSTGEKYAINDPKLIPDYAVLDPTLLIGLPKGVTSTTGMDALTHAVEAYIGRSNTKETKKYAIEAVKLIFEYLEKSVNEPKNLEYREQMQIAAYKAGVAFTNAYVGQVHSIAHALGGKYNVPHGLANAFILPIVLRRYGKKSEKKLAELADAVGIAKEETRKEKAEAFIKAIENMNEGMGVTNSFGILIKDEDIPFLSKHAYKETVPLYPVPRIFDKEEIGEIYKLLKK